MGKFRSFGTRPDPKSSFSKRFSLEIAQSGIAGDGSSVDPAADDDEIIEDVLRMLTFSLVRQVTGLLRSDGFYGFTGDERKDSHRNNILEADELSQP